MVPTAFTTASWLSHVFQRWMRAGHVRHIALVEGDEAFSVGLDEDEQGIATVRTDAGPEFLLTTSRMIAEGETLFRFEDIDRCWLIANPDPIGVRRGKQPKILGIVVTVKAGARITIDVQRLGDGLFPLYRFLRSLASGDEVPS
jgi:hypothetical protein